MDKKGIPANESLNREEKQLHKAIKKRNKIMNSIVYLPQETVQFLKRESCDQFLESLGFFQFVEKTVKKKIISAKFKDCDKLSSEKLRTN